VARWKCPLPKFTSFQIIQLFFIFSPPAISKNGINLLQIPYKNILLSYSNLSNANKFVNIKQNSPKGGNVTGHLGAFRRNLHNGRILLFGIGEQRESVGR
jgi:hypothetical protein